MKHIRISAMVIALSVPSTSVLAQAKYTEPWDPAVEAAAERAVAALGAKRSLDVRATILTVPDLVAGGN